MSTGFGADPYVDAATRHLKDQAAGIVTLPNGDRVTWVNQCTCYGGSHLGIHERYCGTEQA